jgi:glutamate-5-semialdehyde dehydrogenase
MSLNEMGQSARKAARQLSQATGGQKNSVLLALAGRLSADSPINDHSTILAANAQDLEQAHQQGLSPALLDRLMLNPDRLQSIANDLRTVAGLPDPIGEQFEAQTLPNGLKVHKQRVPLGVLGIIYEARPNVTLDVAGLAIKTGNAAILRGGSETLNSNRVLTGIVQQTLIDSSLPPDAIQFIDDPDRARVLELLQMQEYIDLLIPRGGAGLHQFCRENSRIPVITGGIGICHLFIDESADLAASVRVIHNAKVQRPTVCNALDTVLVHRTIAAGFLPLMIESLAQSGVSFRADPSAWPYLTGAGDAPLPANVLPAGPDDFDTEWLSLVLGIKVVDTLDEAIDHITLHSTGHSDGILTGDLQHAQCFIQQVDSAAVYVNASTRFTDGAQLGLGAEVAISTQRVHARGPLGPRELTTYKWVIEGDYHTRT